MKTVSEYVKDALKEETDIKLVVFYKPINDYMKEVWNVGINIINDNLKILTHMDAETFDHTEVNGNNLDVFLKEDHIEEETKAYMITDEELRQLPGFNEIEMPSDNQMLKFLLLYRKVGGVFQSNDIYTINMIKKEW